MTTSIRTSADGLSSIIAVNGVDRFSIDQNGKVTAAKFAGDGSELTGILKSGTTINTTSGTAHDFTGIPAWVKRITVMFKGVSTNGTSPFLIRVGSGSIVSSGYASQAWSVYGYVVDATGLAVVAPTAAGLWTGAMTLVRCPDNSWMSSGALNVTDVAAGGTTSVGYSPELAGSLDRIRLTTVNGTDLFDAGQINILYE